MNFKLPPGMNERQFLGVIKRQYEADYARAFGVSPVEAAHMFAHFRDGYMGLLDEIIEEFGIDKPKLALPEANMDPEAKFDDRYVLAGYVLRKMREKRLADAIVEPPPTPFGSAFWAEGDPRDANLDRLTDILVLNDKTGDTTQATAYTRPECWSVRFCDDLDWAQDIEADDVWPAHYLWVRL